jgi:hypothetical protein
VRRHALAGLPALLLFIVALAIRNGQHHTALLYPDGYQYLLMARGISEHLQPTTVLGPGGDAFAPSPDAAVKPFFPLLVAAAHLLGVSWLDAARLVTSVAAASAVVLLARLVSRLSGSSVAGLASGVLFLSSPGVALWSGFSGPDPLACALALGAALAFVDRRPRLGGILTGLAIATRPEIVVVAVGAAILSLRYRKARRELARAAPATALTTTLVFASLRVPVAIHDWRLVWLSPLLVAPIALATLASDQLRQLAAVAALAAAGFVVLTSAGPAELWHSDWPLLVLGAAGFVVLIRDREQRATAMLAMGLVLLLGSVYLLKNPGLGRYFALLLPSAAVVAGVAITPLPRRARALAVGAIGAASLVGFLRPVPGSHDYDAFSLVATRVGSSLEAEPLVTAAPDAYGFWLPTRTVHEMRPGARGAVLLDAAQRLYAPRLTAKGVVVARVSDEIAFARPDGEIDAEPAVLIVGRVSIARRGSEGGEASASSSRMSSNECESEPVLASPRRWC